MSAPERSSPKKTRPTAKARVMGSGAIAQGKRARAAGKRAVIVAGDNTGSISTGDTYQTFIQRADRPGASAAGLRNAYLAWLSARANELPLYAADSGQPVQLSSLYTALLTQAPQDTKSLLDTAARTETAAAGRESGRLSALEALDKARYLVLMGGPGSGKSTFLNFVALCMAGEMLGLAAANLKVLCAPIPRDPDARDKKPTQQRWTRQALLPVRVALRDFAGYEDGTENPKDAKAIRAAFASGRGAGLDGSSFVAVQRRMHDFARFEAMRSAMRIDANKAKLVGRGIGVDLAAPVLSCAPERRGVHGCRCNGPSMRPKQVVGRMRLPSHRSTILTRRLSPWRK